MKLTKPRYKNWYFEGYYKGATYSNFVDHYMGIDATKPTIVMFIPKLFTPICMTELNDLSDLKNHYKARGIQLIVATCDSPEVIEQAVLDLNDVWYPIIKIAPIHRKLWRYVSGRGYPHRVTIYMLDHNVLGEYRVHDSDIRDPWKQLDQASLLFLDNITNS